MSAETLLYTATAATSTGNSEACRSSAMARYSGTSAGIKRARSAGATTSSVHNDHMDLEQAAAAARADLRLGNITAQTGSGPAATYLPMGGHFVTSEAAAGHQHLQQQMRYHNFQGREQYQNQQQQQQIHLHMQQQQQQQQRQQQQLQNHHHHQEQQLQYQQYQQQQSTAMYARREDLTRSPSRKTRKPDGVKDSMMEGTREPMVNLGATGGGKSCNTPSDRREKLRSERRKLKASLRLADLHVQELNLQAPRCVVCQCPFANYEECQTAQNCMRGKRNFLTIKLRKLERSIASYEKKASITPSTVRYMPFLRSKRKVSSTEASTSPDSTSSMNSSPPSPSSLDLSADQSVQQQQQQEHTHSGRGKSDKTTHGPTIRLGYVNYFRSLRSEGLNTKKCPMCTKPLNDMATFLSTLDRFSFLAYQRFFDESSWFVD